MRIVAQDPGQTVQRVKVGLTGLALVLLLIGLASAIFSSASKERPVDVTGAPKADIVANLSVTNDDAIADAAKTSEPLAELGVAPSTANDSAVEPPPVVRTIPAPNGK